ncbi:hypothetical protein [Escherichia phage rV5_ev146]|uniref:Uncharacterized protein n=2 Tax=Vequintavirus TaxID=1914852 RepID=A0A653HBR6_9CAUD|nr:structural protein [Escherichia phage APECc02]AKO61819.1 structural protein [Escherichia phage APECc02]VVG93940.1 hypothetical protein [Escherichia phage rV5_ev146]
MVELGLFRYFWLTLQVCVGKANLSGGAGGHDGKIAGQLKNLRGV